MAFRGNYSITLNYPTAANNEPRWGYGKPSHPLLYEMIDRQRKDYEKLLYSFLEYKDQYQAINKHEDEKVPAEPHLATPWLPGLDSLALYALLAIYKPAKYIEVGSGNSTKFTRRSIRDNTLKTKLISIDPEPRTEIDTICDQVLRKPVEEVDCLFFDQLEANDILFVDNSHRCFMNSDATVIFLEILPRLKPGVLVQIHDIFLPNDYPPWFVERYYSEQYLLAAYILAQGQKFDILLPNQFITQDPQLHKIISPIFAAPAMREVGSGGGSFWLLMT
jgi:hypothetical protein